MKIFFVLSGMTHYYNLVLSKLNKVPGMEITLIVPAQTSTNIGPGVYQTKEGISFSVRSMKEISRFRIYNTFRGLIKLFFVEKPDIVVITDAYLLGFVLNISVILVMKLTGIKLILKSIPFMVLRYDEARRQIDKNVMAIKMLPDIFNKLLLSLGMIKIIRTAEIMIRKVAFNIPDAHVNYIDDAFEVYGSYGVPKEKIFITRNSPDTDMLFDVRQLLGTVPPVLPPCEHRLIHVGRLVAWKRVDLLLSVFSRIRKQYADSELLIVGSGPLEEELKSLSVELGIDGDVKFIGGIYDPKALGQYLMSSTIYVLAGMGGLSINDAMCFGLPIICSVCDGTEKMLVRDGFNGKYFKEGDEDDLVEKITYLFRNPALCKQMGVNSTNIIKDEINIHTVIDGYRKAFEYVMQR